jgi:putative spermidine/putrescine transport system permease protein
MTLQAAPSDVQPQPAESPRRLAGLFDGQGGRWLVGPPLVFLALLLIVPLGYVVVLGFQHQGAASSGYHQTFTDPLFRAALWRTFVLAAIVSAMTMVLGTLFALALAVAPRWLAALMLIALFTIFWTSILVRTYGWILLYLPEGPIYEVLHAVGLVHGPISIYQTNFASYPAMVHVMLPYVVLPVFAAARQIDPSLIRAARVLGARAPLILWKVVMPALRAGIAAGAVMVFVMSLGFYVTPTLLGSQTEQLVSTLIGLDFSQPGEAPVAAAMSVALLLVVVVVYVIADRLFGVSEQWGGAA